LRQVVLASVSQEGNCRSVDSVASTKRKLLYQCEVQCSHCAHIAKMRGHVCAGDNKSLSIHNKMNNPFVFIQ